MAKVLIDEIEIDRAFIKKINQLKDDQYYKEPAKCFYTTADIADFVMEQLRDVKSDIISKCIRN